MVADLYRDDKGNVNFAEIIFKKLYNVVVPYVATLTDLEIDDRGIPAAYNASTDTYHDQLVDKTSVSWTIARMIEAHENGLSVAVENPKDISEIYNVLEGHLLVYKNRPKINRGVGPVDDLIKMENFAQEIYDKNKAILIRDELNDTRKTMTTGIMNERAMTQMPEVAVSKITPRGELTKSEYDAIRRDSLAPKSIFNFNGVNKSDLFN